MLKKQKLLIAIFALIGLILSSNYKLSNEEENLVKLATFNLKIFSKDYEELEWRTHILQN